MNSILEKALYYLGYIVTMILLVGALVFIWNAEIIPMVKFLLLLPMIFVGTLLTMSLEDGYHGWHLH